MTGSERKGECGEEKDHLRSGEWLSANREKEHKRRIEQTEGGDGVPALNGRCGAKGRNKRGGIYITEKVGAAEGTVEKKRRRIRQFICRGGDAHEPGKKDFETVPGLLDKRE